MSTSIKSINPANGQVVREFQTISDDALENRIQASHQAFAGWRAKSVEDRGEILRRVGDKLAEHKDRLLPAADKAYAALIEDLEERGLADLPIRSGVEVVDHDSLVWPEGGINPCFKIEGGAGLVMRKGIGGVIGGPHCIHPEAGEQSMCTEVVFGEALVSSMPYILCGVRVEQGIDAKAAAEFEMGPVEERISGGMRNGLGPGLELFPG